MSYEKINLESIKSLKSTDKYTLTCDNCQKNISRTVKDIRTCIRKKTKYIVCSRSCQASLSRPKVIYNNKCLVCDTEFSVSYKDQKFCSRSCSSKYNNTNKVKSKETILKISNTLKLNSLSKKKIVGEFSRVKTCKCQSCGTIGIYRKQQRYCNNCSHMYSESGRAKFAFTFNVYNHPDLFDLSLIETYGWRKTKGKNKNTNGISRDHKVSVRDSIKYNYDSYYIKHPLNCELMRHNDNQSKGTKSSITYEELVKLVNDYDASH